jgi:hypothetical protein
MHPIPSDMHYHWVLARMVSLKRDEMCELVEDAWRMVVAKSVAAAYGTSVLSDESSTTPTRRSRSIRRRHPA